MNRHDIETSINHYFTNCGQNAENWDVDAIIDEIWNMNIESIDDISEDAFTDILIRHEH